MSDKSIPDTPAAVAFVMAKEIYAKERHDLSSYRKDFLDLYAECLEAAIGRRSLSSSAKSSVTFSD
ncbi:MAG: hypothetical protein P1U57_05760 [Oleibacter sp.]|nr:hypothetical protein [Thalassolituus sp.]